MSTSILRAPATPPPGSAPPAQPAPAEGKGALSARPGERIRVDVNLVLVPITVTDPLNRLVTGLDKEDFFVYDNNALQKIKDFLLRRRSGFDRHHSGPERQHVEQGDPRPRTRFVEFMKTANPQDEFFVIGFNDRPELIEDFTGSVEDIQARLMTIQPGHRTALLDAIYFGMSKDEAGQV